MTRDRMDGLTDQIDDYIGEVDLDLGPIEGLFRTALTENVAGVLREMFSEENIRGADSIAGFSSRGLTISIFQGQVEWVIPWSKLDILDYANTAADGMRLMKAEFEEFYNRKWDELIKNEEISPDDER